MPTATVDDPTVPTTPEEQDKFLRELGEEIERPYVTPVEVTVNITKANDPTGANAIDLVWPMNGADILDRGLSFEAARQLSVDLNTAALFLRDLRHQSGFDF